MLPSPVRSLGLQFVGLLALSACDHSSKDAAQDVAHEVERLTNTLTEYVKQAEVPGEIKKLQQFEYRVVTLPLDTKTDELESQLNELGKDRWECFHSVKSVRSEKVELTFFCKRRPETPLRFVPRTILGGS